MLNSNRIFFFSVSAKQNRFYSADHNSIAFYFEYDTVKKILMSPALACCEVYHFFFVKTAQAREDVNLSLVFLIFAP